MDRPVRPSPALVSHVAPCRQLRRRQAPTAATAKAAAVQAGPPRRRRRPGRHGGAPLRRQRRVQRRRRRRRRVRVRHAVARARPGVVRRAVVPARVAAAAAFTWRPKPRAVPLQRRRRRGGARPVGRLRRWKGRARVQVAAWPACRRRGASGGALRAAATFATAAAAKAGPPGGGGSGRRRGRRCQWRLNKPSCIAARFSALVLFSSLVLPYFVLVQAEARAVPSCRRRWWLRQWRQRRWAVHPRGRGVVVTAAAAAAVASVGRRLVALRVRQQQQLTAAAAATAAAA